MLSDLLIALLYSTKRITDLLLVVLVLAELSVLPLRLRLVEQQTNLAKYFGQKQVELRDQRDKPALMAQSAIDFVYRVLGNDLLSLYSIFKFFIISCVVSSVAIIVGSYIDLHFKGAVSFDEVVGDLIPFQGFYRSEILFPFNAFLDIVALHITIRCLRGIIREKGLLFRVSMVLFDLFCALLLAFGSTVGIKVLSSYQLQRGSEITMQTIYETYEIYRSFLAQANWFDGTHNFDAFLFGVTALFPTAAYFTYLLFVIFKNSAVNAYVRTDFSKTIERLFIFFTLIVGINFITEKIIDYLE